MRSPEHGLLKSEVSSSGTDRFSGQQETNRADKFEKSVDSLPGLGELQPERGPFHWRVPGPYPKDCSSTRQYVERGQLGRKREWFLETCIEHAGAEADPVRDDRCCGKSNKGAGQRTDMIRDIEAIEARAIGGLGQLHPLGLIDESTLD